MADATRHREWAWELFTILSARKEVVATALRRALKETTFSNRMMLAPRRLFEIGQDEVSYFVKFLESNDAAMVTEHGKKLAMDGLGRQSLMAMTTALRHTCLELMDLSNKAWFPYLNVVDAYISCLTDGYIAGCEEDIRREQELTREAYVRTLAQPTSGG